MDDTDAGFLKQGIGRQIAIRFRDGEITPAEPLLVSDEDQDLIYDVVSSNRPEKCPALRSVAYCASFSEIEATAGPDLLAAIIGILFAPGEQSVFIDSAVAIEEIVGEVEQFARIASDRFSTRVDAKNLWMTVPEFALHLRSTKP